MGFRVDRGLGYNGQIEVGEWLVCVTGWFKFLENMFGIYF